ncbi:hypothetical protein GCM10009809_39610 [Isoptericola hypogeus]|uniref:Uncharacterized protein n=1 Tax=Isoptericola hypogeus TaxID=300179 RepID=A0ABN2JVB1_9MICO
MGRTGSERGGTVRRWLPLRLALVVLVVALAAVVALLARSTDRLVLATYRGVPGGVEADLADPELGWVLGDDGKLAVYAAGSSSCPWVPTRVTADGNHLVVQLGSGGEDDGALHR